MKNLVKILLFSVIAFGMNSCTEEKILDLEPINNIGEKDAFSTPQLVEAYMNVYITLLLLVLITVVLQTVVEVMYGGLHL